MRVSASEGLDRVRTAARLNRKERFTALLHHVDTGLLRSAYFWLKRDAAAGGSIGQPCAKRRPVSLLGLR